MDPVAKWMIRATFGLVIATGVFTMHTDSIHKQKSPGDQAHNTGW